MRQRRMYSGKKVQRVSLIALLGLLSLVMVACVGMPTQPSSPLPPGTDPRLVTNRWQVVEVTDQGQDVPFDAIQPVYISFAWYGRMLVNSTDCRAGSVWIYFADERHYDLDGGAETANDCGELRNKQYAAITDALDATHEYAFEEGQLVLSGDKARLVLKVAEAYPPFPSAERALNINRWRWVAVMAQGEPVALDALPPLYTGFSEAGWLSVWAGKCLEGYYRIVANGEDTYELTQNSLQLEGCGDRGEAQAQQALDALAATTQAALRGQWLFLSGADSWVVLEIDNPPANE